MVLIWFQLSLMIGVLGMVIMGTYYYWQSELLCKALADDQQEVNNHLE